MDESTATSILLPLDGERAVTFEAQGKPVTYHFPRLSKAAWMKFFLNIVVETETEIDAHTKEDLFVQRVDTNSAFLGFVTENVAKVEGYKLSDGSELMSIEHWRDRLPAAHRIAAGKFLASASAEVSAPSDDAEFIIAAEGDAVTLTAAWGIAAPGEMRVYNGLVHRFRTPSLDDQRRVRRAMSEAKMVGGSRTSRTIYPSKHAMYVEMYDSLILSVDGYSIAGQPLTGAEKIAFEMDAQHKVAAVRELFKETE